MPVSRRVVLALCLFALLGAVSCSEVWRDSDADAVAASIVDARADAVAVVADPAADPASKAAAAASIESLDKAAAQLTQIRFDAHAQDADIGAQTATARSIAAFIPPPWNAIAEPLSFALVGGISAYLARRCPARALKQLAVGLNAAKKAHPALASELGTATWVINTFVDTSSRALIDDYRGANDPAHSVDVDPRLGAKPVPATI